jgi:hypothetical protein
MARYRLGRHAFSPSLNSKLVAKLCQNAEDKLWPSLVEEARLVVEAIDEKAIELGSLSHGKSTQF